MPHTDTTAKGCPKCPLEHVADVVLLYQHCGPALVAAEENVAAGWVATLSRVLELASFSGLNIRPTCSALEYHPHLPSVMLSRAATRLHYQGNCNPRHLGGASSA